MKKIISFSRSSLKGTIIDYSGYPAWGKVPVKNIKIQELESRDAIYTFIKRMELFLYSNNEIDNLYFFYKAGKVLHAVRYNVYYGMTTITDFPVEEDLQVCFEGKIQVFLSTVFYGWPTENQIQNAG